MTNKQKNKLLCVDDLRHAEYYQMQDTIKKYLQLLKLDKSQLAKLNKYRELAGNRLI